MFLIDTDIIIYNLKGHDTVRKSLRRHIHDPIMISAFTLMELYYGAYKSQNVESNLAKVKKIESGLGVIAVDRESVEVFGLLKSGLEKSGQPLDDFDLILAATALSHNFVLVTNNERHFARVNGLKIDNWSK